MSEIEISIRSGKVFVTKSGIICQMVNSCREFTLADAQEVVTATENLSHGKTSPILVSMGQIKFVSTEARQYLENNTTATAVAFLVSSLVTRLAGSFLMKLSRTAIPVKMFSSKSDALSWLERYL